ncbi:MAG: AMP-binding protein, partial [Blastocatellia bacterium]|nr:AMP-binding protein [Blastocatellia bacterium]
FSKSQTDKLYRTGDLARWLDDGTIEFLGRLDHQVKIRGFRIELGEIESTLEQHLAVKEVVVIAKEHELGDKQLVAYLVLNENETQHPSVGELQEWLRNRLPQYMVPALFVYLNKIPLTPNGKVDRKALPEPEQNRPKSVAEVVAPRNHIEEQLTEIWKNSLKLDQISINDNFFELGGDSILALRIIARADQKGIKFTPLQFFQNPTIAQLANLVNFLTNSLAQQDLVVGAILLTPIQTWFFEQNFAELHHWNLSVNLKTKRVLDLKILEPTFQQLLLHHDALRIRFNLVESTWQQYNLENDETKIIETVYIKELSKLKQNEEIELICNNLQSSLNISSGPIIQARLFNFPDQSQSLFITIHHLVIDNISWQILLDDLQQIYLDIERNKSISLPLKTTSYKQWSESLSKYLEIGFSKEEKAYWLTQLKKPLSPLPRDFINTANTEVSLNTISVSLDEDETTFLLRKVPEIYNTQINDVFLLALAISLTKWTNNKYSLVDLESHGRENIIEGLDLSRTLGWFTSIFPFVLELTNEFNIGASLKAIKEQVRAIPNHGIGYGIIKYLEKDKEFLDKIELLPKAEVLFNYLGQLDQVLENNELFFLSQEPIGKTRSHKAKRAYLLEVNASIVYKKITIVWSYSDQIHKKITIENLANQYLSALKAIIQHCQSPEESSYTPSDFPKSGLSQTELDELIFELIEEEEDEDESTN